MPSAPKPRYQIPQMATPHDWNPPGTYLTASVALLDHEEPLEWRSHESARAMPDDNVATKVLNFISQRQDYEDVHGPRPDFWALYEIDAPPDKKLIIHQSLADRIPTVYMVPATGPNAFQLPTKYEPIMKRA